MQTAGQALTGQYQPQKYSFEWWGHEYGERRKKWVSLDDKASELELRRKPLRAELFNHHRQEAGSDARAESKAEASKEYQGHLKDMRVARTEANIALAEMLAFEKAFEAWRTEQSTRRAEAGIR